MAEQGAVNAHTSHDADTSAHLHDNEGAQEIATRRELHGCLSYAARAPPTAARLQVRTPVGLLCVSVRTQNQYMFKIE